MRDRLIELIIEKIPTDTPIDCLPDVDAIADYLLANGVIVAPCKVGDIVYKIFYGKIVEMRVVAIPILISSLGTHLSVTVENWREACISLDLDDFGKTVFLTRDLAEEALKNEQEKHRI